MKSYLQRTDYELWEIIRRGYVVPKTTPRNEEAFKEFQLNLQAIEKLHGAIDEKAFDIMDGLETAKEI